MPFGVLFAALMISYIPLPFRAGEVARGVVTSAKTGMPVARVFSTILVEKVLDVLALLFLLGISLPFVELSEELKGSASLLGIAVVAFALVLLALVIRPDIARRVVHAVASRLPARFGPRIEATVDHVLDGLGPLSRPRVATRLGLWSLGTWGVNSITVYLLLLAFNINVSPLAAVVVVVTSNLSMVVPAAPGYVGTFELAVQKVLEILGQPGDVALAFALVYHVVGLAPVAILGVIAAIQQGVGLAAFRSEPPATDEELAVAQVAAHALHTPAQTPTPAAQSATRPATGPRDE